MEITMEQNEFQSLVEVFKKLKGWRDEAEAKALVEAPLPQVAGAAVH
jgi:hypothetical protein